MFLDEYPTAKAAWMERERNKKTRYVKTKVTCWEGLSRIAHQAVISQMGNKTYRVTIYVLIVNADRKLIAADNVRPNTFELRDLESAKTFADLYLLGKRIGLTQSGGGILP